MLVNIKARTSYMVWWYSGWKLMQFKKLLLTHQPRKVVVLWTSIYLKSSPWFLICWIHWFYKAEKLVSKSSFPETASTNEWARFLYYTGQCQWSSLVCHWICGVPVNSWPFTSTAREVKLLFSLWIQKCSWEQQQQQQHLYFWH